MGLFKKQIGIPHVIWGQLRGKHKMHFEHGQLTKLDRGSHQALLSAKSPLGIHVLPAAQGFVRLARWR